MSDQYGDGIPDYPPMPGEPPGGPVVPLAPPAPVLSAVRLMFIRAATGVLGTLVLLATKNTLKEAILRANPNADAAKLDSLVNSALTFGIVFALIFIVLYVLLAMQVRNGRNWARIVTWVLAGLGVLSALASLAQAQPALSRILSLIGGAIDVAIIVLLAQRPSGQYFQAHRSV